MTNLFEPLARLCRRALFCLVTVLAACGPGTGGTGTGPIAFSGNALSGASMTVPACQSNCDVVNLQLDELRVELTAACRRFVYFGSWSVGADGELILSGAIETTLASATTSAPGTLRVQFGDKGTAGNEATVMLFDAAGALLSGPSVLSKVAAVNPAAPACGKS